MNNNSSKGVLFLIGGFILVLVLAGVLLVKPLFDKGTARNQPGAQSQSAGDQPGNYDDSASTLPQGLTPGVWLFPAEADTAIFAFSRDNKAYIGFAPGTYQKTSPNALEFCFLTLTDEQGKPACATLTVSKIINPQKVEIMLASKYSDAEKLTLEKRFGDASYGDLPKDVIGTWAYGGNIDEALSNTQYEMIFDASGHITDRSRGSASYTIDGDRLTMFGEVYQALNWGGFMILTGEDSENNPRVYFLVRK